MAALGTSGQRLIRCPICLILQNSTENVLPQSYLTCCGCKRLFQAKSALPAKTLSTEAEKPGTATETGVLPSVNLCLAYLIPAIIIGFLGRSFSGPGFLVYFACVFLCAFTVSTLMRWNGTDSWAVSIYGCIFFEAVAVTRLFTSQSPLPRNYSFLFAMMFIGGLLFFMRTSDFQGDSSGSSSGSSCGGGGCGGGGCGGGGCGG